VRAVREYDLADISLQGELAKRWPEAHVNPGYTGGHDGIRQDPLNDVMHENALGVGFELPVFNQHQGAIGEAVARRDTAREHLVAIQADMYEQIDRAQRAWPRRALPGGGRSGGSDRQPPARGRGTGAHGRNH